MLQDNRKDLDAERRKPLLERLLKEIGRDNPDLYYRSTSEIAQLIAAHIERGATLHPEERALVQGLSPRDIAVVLSLH
ncbi:hypothetical protein [Pacificoceanicola onchidii]|uniref:hypothetical protein n=1 Tax=Pacificoceanicola onchidii TaxID=2562685 RepID=UPI0010A4E5AB|nr:hypothetical protein [Pacificoceanicola onchidii]